MLPSLDGTDDTCVLFGASGMESPSDIPLLLSLGTLSKKLQAVLDFCRTPRNVAYLGVFNIEFPIVKINGHVCISLNRFPNGHFMQWKAMSSILDESNPYAQQPPPLSLQAWREVIE